MHVCVCAKERIWVRKIGERRIIEIASPKVTMKAETTLLNQTFFSTSFRNKQEQYGDPERFAQAIACMRKGRNESVRLPSLPFSPVYEIA